MDFLHRVGHFVATIFIAPATAASASCVVGAPSFFPPAELNSTSGILVDSVAFPLSPPPLKGLCYFLEIYVVLFFLFIHVIMGDSDFTIEVHHERNFFDNKHRLEYLCRMIVDDLYFDVDEWSLQDIVSKLKKLWYKGYARLWYKELGMDLNSNLREMKSDGDAMRMARSLVSGSVKHCKVYVVDAVKEGKRIKITSSDIDYVPVEGDDNCSGLLKFEVEDNDPQSNAFGGFNGPLNEEVPAARVAQGDEGLGEVDKQIEDIFYGYEIEKIDSYEEDSDDMIKNKRFPRYNEFKDAIKEHVLLNGKDTSFKKNNKVRCRVVCNGRKSKCKWIYFASKVGGSDYFRIKTLHEKHTCGRNYNGRLASSNWISNKIANNISQEEEMKLAIVIQTIQNKYMANISVDNARLVGQGERQAKRLDVITVRATEWQVTWAKDLKFEVHHTNRMIMERFVVNLLAGSDNLKDYCSNYYSSASYVATYGKSVSPINGENM
ncbi:hypothetical protein Ahy_A06g027650 [Arachis hypogaea]|uniref:PB1-like domain-containing protein n=1 Tax=Arachis hypogaea TaxID=3818 RepID=A0A445CPC7_ARAHY|nr:hypothetical protein Ahy_A06g027650 [Arachis hypogaea]